MSRKRSRRNFEIAILLLIAIVVSLFLSHNEIVVYIAAAVFVAVTVWFIVRMQKRPIPKEEISRTYTNLILLFALVGAAWVGLTGNNTYKVILGIGIGIVVGILIIIFVIWQVVKWQKRKAITSDIDKHLRKALETMDSTAKWYNNEEEANRELVTCLKAQGISDVMYQYRLGNGRTADARVGDVLIEGKLSPDTAEVDRLIGQLSDYTHYHKVNVVIYGQLDKDARRRIENEIHLRYTGRVFLTCLNNPRRQRAPLAI